MKARFLAVLLMSLLSFLALSQEEKVSRRIYVGSSAVYSLDITNSRFSGFKAPDFFIGRVDAYYIVNGTSLKYSASFKKQMLSLGFYVSDYKRNGDGRYLNASGSYKTIDLAYSPYGFRNSEKKFEVSPYLSVVYHMTSLGVVDRFDFTNTFSRESGYDIGIGVSVDKQLYKRLWINSDIVFRKNLNFGLNQFRVFIGIGFRL